MGKPVRKQLGAILIDAGVVTEAELKRVLDSAEGNGKRLGERLVDANVCTEKHIASALSSQLGLNQIDLRRAAIDPEAVSRIPEELARKHFVMPVSIGRQGLAVAMADPLNLLAMDDAEFASGFKVSPCISTSSDILWAIEKHYQLTESMDAIVADLSAKATIEQVHEPGQEAPDGQDLERRSQAAPIIRMVNTILSTAISQNASDIHIEPMPEHLIVRNRIDGQLRQQLEMPKWVQGAVISRIKNMAHIDIADKNTPQQGRIRIRMAKHTFDLRISILPTSRGEKVVIRLLYPKSSPATVEQLGFEKKDARRFISWVSRPQGMVLVAGPAGSGTTTTLYAALTQIRSITRNITTIEDPIEYELDGTYQVEVNESAGRTFTSTIPAILHQDPDVVMVGELRDLETATLAMQAAFTGRLVLSTMRTKSSVATITWLKNLGIPAHSIASAVNGILAQRLVRVICPHCKSPDTPAEEDLWRIGLTKQQAAQLTFYRGTGCEKCGQTGYAGRIGVYELLTMSPRLKQLVAEDATEATVRQVATAEGFTTLLHAGIAKVSAGITSVAELIRVTQMDEHNGAMCPQCNQLIGPEFIACPHCGLRLLQTCGTCRGIMDPGWRFCPFCASQIAAGMNLVDGKQAKAS